MRLGKLFFQASDRLDVFLSCDVRPDGVVPTYESSNNLPVVLFEQDKAWINGQVPVRNEVNVSPDTALLHCWFRGETFNTAFTIRISLECEMVEEIVSHQEASQVSEQMRKAGPCDYNDRCLLDFEDPPPCPDSR